MSSVVKNNKVNSNGFTMIELILVLTLLAIISAVIVPRFIGYKEKAKEDVCRINRVELERMYDLYLVTNDIEHSNDNFNNFINQYDKELCPSSGIITYSNGEIKCSVHRNNDEESSNEENDDGDGSVPFL